MQDGIRACRLEFFQKGPFIYYVITKGGEGGQAKCLLLLTRGRGVQGHAYVIMSFCEKGFFRQKLFYKKNLDKKIPRFAHFYLQSFDYIVFVQVSFQKFELETRFIQHKLKNFTSLNLISVMELMEVSSNWNKKSKDAIYETLEKSDQINF